MTDAFAAVTPDPVVELVGEGKKFKTVADLAKGKLEADAFIEQLKNEAAELRKELGAKVDADTALTELRSELKQIKEAKAVTPQKENTTPSLSDSDLKSLIARTITEQEQHKTSAQNVTAANNAVVQHYGSVEKAQEALQTRARELNLSIDELRSTAAKSPTAFLRLVLPEAEQRAASSGLNSSVNTSALTQMQGTPQEGTKEFYDALRVKNPKLYFTPEVQNKIFKAAMAGTYDYRAGLDRG